MEQYEIKQIVETKHGEGKVVLVKHKINKDRKGKWEGMKFTNSTKLAGVIVDAIIELDNGFVILNWDLLTVKGKQTRVLWESDLIPKETAG